jgi:hypothetical protein
MEPYFIKADVPFNDEKENSNAGKICTCFFIATPHPKQW